MPSEEIKPRSMTPQVTKKCIIRGWCICKMPPVPVSTDKQVAGAKNDVPCCCPKSKQAVLTWAYIKMALDIASLTGILLGLYFCNKVKYWCCLEYINTVIDLLCVYFFYCNAQFGVVIYIGLYKGILGTHKMAPYYRYGKKVMVLATIVAMFMMLVSPYSIVWPYRQGIPVNSIPDSFIISALVAIELFWFVLDSMLIYKLRKHFYVDFKAFSFTLKCDCVIHELTSIHNNYFRV